MRGSALRWAQRDEGGFRFPPYIPLDSHTPLKRPGLWSWTLGCMIGFANPHGSRVATLVVWGGEWEVQEGLGRASKPSPTLLAPAERVPLSCESLFTCFINILSPKKTKQSMKKERERMPTFFSLCQFLMNQRSTRPEPEPFIREVTSATVTRL